MSPLFRLEIVKLQVVLSTIVEDSSNKYKYLVQYPVRTFKVVTTRYKPTWYQVYVWWGISVSMMHKMADGCVNVARFFN